MKKSALDYWDTGYSARSDLQPIDLSRPASRSFQHIGRLLDEAIEDGMSVAEVGGGGSGWLAHLAQSKPAARFSSIDYSPAGNELISRFAQRHGLSNLTAELRDIFDDGPVRQYDVVYSLGVVEHFDDLGAVLRQVTRFCQPGGLILSVIPNMAGLIGTFTKTYAPAVYAIHNPHDLPSFLHGHRAAGLQVLEAGYLGSTNFGVLSSCFKTPDDRGYRAYVWLSRLSKALDRLETRIRPWPVTKLFSPYIYALARRET